MGNGDGCITDSDSVFAGGFINAVFANSFDDVSIIPTFVLTPLTYLGACFIPSACCQSSGRGFQLNPILYMVNTFRFGILGVSDIDIVFAFSMIIVFILVLFAYSLHLLSSGRGIRH
ncbi:ABC transporter permease [Aliamphritea spongicola]